MGRRNHDVTNHQNGNNLVHDVPVTFQASKGYQKSPKSAAQFCIECGTKLNEESKFCLVCGSGN